MVAGVVSVATVTSVQVTTLIAVRFDHNPYLYQDCLYYHKYSFSTYYLVKEDVKGSFNLVISLMKVINSASDQAIKYFAQN